MSKAIEGLQPALVWKYFEEIARIPRCSGNEAGITKNDAFALQAIDTIADCVLGKVCGGREILLLCACSVLELGKNCPVWFCNFHLFTYYALFTHINIFFH